MRAILLLLEGVELPAAFHEDESAARQQAGAFLKGELPALEAIGLGESLQGRIFDPPARRCDGSYGRMRRHPEGDPSFLSALWEAAGVINRESFARFSPPLIESLEAATGQRFLGKRQGTLPEMIAEYGAEHLATGAPILFSSDGVRLELIAHQSVLPGGRFYQLCRAIRSAGDDLRLTMLSAHLMEGPPGAWQPQGEPQEFSLVPPRTIFNALSEQGFKVEAIGPIGATFAYSGITAAYPENEATSTLATLTRRWEALDRGVAIAHLPVGPGPWEAGTPGHRDLLALNDWLADFLHASEADDLLLLAGLNAAPEREGPILLCYDGRRGPLGLRESATDLAATLAAFFDLHHHGFPGTPLLSFYRQPGSLIP